MALTVAEAAAEVERRRAATAILEKARKMSKGQRILLREIDRYHQSGFSTEDQVKSKSLEILHDRFGYLDRQRVPRQDLGDGRFTLAYWNYTINEAGVAALAAQGIRLETPPKGAIPGATGPDNGYGPTVTIEDLENNPALAAQYRSLKWPKGAIAVADAALTEPQILALAELVLLGGPGQPSGDLAEVVTAELSSMGLVLAIADGNVIVTPEAVELFRCSVVVPAQIGLCGNCGTHFKMADLPGDAMAVAGAMMKVVEDGCPACGLKDKLFASQAAPAVAWWVLEGRNQ